MTDTTGHGITDAFVTCEEYARMEEVARLAQAALRRVGAEIDARLDIGHPSPEDLRMWRRMIEEALNG